MVVEFRVGWLALLANAIILLFCKAESMAQSKHRANVWNHTWTATTFHCKTVFITTSHRQVAVRGEREQLNSRTITSAHLQWEMATGLWLEEKVDG
jgi:hypothetical protein